AIVVGINHAGAKRLDEYMPWVNDQYGGGAGKAFADFMVQTLKPYVDSVYRTMPDRANTIVAGSSLGGLMSLYIVLHYNEVFAKACVFSPSFFINPEINDFTRQTAFTGSSKIYFYMGGMEAEEMVEDMYRIYNIVSVKENSGNDFRFVVDYNKTHTEAAWRYELPLAIKWLMEK
ncbi:MAG: alpha/beta hydrolase, partial [Chitinophagales bacterium]